MTDQSNWMEFTRFVPGFEFLKNLTPPGVGAAVGNAPAAGFQQWLAPTMDESEIQKRIDELKVVQFWLEQNSRALEASIQALEVQKATLSTLKSMHAGMQQMGQAFADGVKHSAPPTGVKPIVPATAAQPAPEPVLEKYPAKGQSEAATEQPELQYLQAQAGQWWSALSEQFQSIASKALEDIGNNVAAMQQEALAGQAGAHGSAAQTPAPAPVAAKKTSRARAAAKVNGMPAAGKKNR